MKLKIGALVSLGAAAVIAQATFTALPASASLQYMIKNVATGKCLQGNDNGTTNAYQVKMATCNPNNAAQWWGGVAHKIMMVRASGTASQRCLSVPTSPSGQFARDVFTAPCGAAGYNQTLSFGVTSNYPLYSGSTTCYIGHYSASDTWPSCYVNSGSYTRWTWVPA
ncbi:ricin-type beta-trefoil lectin domain protein [Microbispora sp. NPDC049125]|uniref:ricin-type beta-trefoil lectin domain protein n=1 Tax=Microbispora sp. NPDC049125 TaxID=3154929 RepID=UPI003467DFDE